MAEIAIVGGFFLSVLTCAATAFWLTGGYVSPEFWQVLAVAWGGFTPIVAGFGLLAWLSR